MLWQWSLGWDCARALTSSITSINKCLTNASAASSSCSPSATSATCVANAAATASYCGVDSGNNSEASKELRTGDGWTSLKISWFWMLVYDAECRKPTWNEIWNRKVSTWNDRTHARCTLHGACYMAHATWRMLHGALLSWEPNELSSFVAASVRCSPCSAKASATTRRSALRGRSWAGSCQRHAKQRYHCHRDEINPHIFCVILLESFIYTFLHTRFHDNLHAGYYYK